MGDELASNRPLLLCQLRLLVLSLPSLSLQFSVGDTAWVRD